MPHEFRKFEWKNLFGLPIFPSLKKYYQKDTSRGFLIFKPSEYKSTDSQERAKMAYQDAKNHANFYKTLVKKHLLPPETKVKAKRIKHSDSYHVEIVMPHVPWEYMDMVRDIRSRAGYRSGDEQSAHYSVVDTKREIKEAARSKGYDYTHFISTTSGTRRDERGEFSGDLNDYVNYRFYRNGGVAYIDAEILTTKLPFKGRKEAHMEFMSRRNREEFMEERRKEKENLEKRIEKPKMSVLISWVSLISSILLVSFNLTGNVIANSPNVTLNWVGGVLFVIGLIGSLVYFRKR